MSYELAVIGLGPGGGSTLYYAAKHGVKTIGLDKRREVGIPIQCGEFLPQSHMYKEILPNAKHIELLTTFPKYIIRNIIKKVSLYSPKGREYMDFFDGYVINRSEYDKWLVSKSIDEGAETLIQTTVYDITRLDDKYLIKAKSGDRDIEIKAENLVIAAGSSSSLIEKVGLVYETDKYNLSNVIQFVMAGVEIDNDKVEMYSGKRYAPGTYAWIIPRNNGYANVGLGIRKPFISRKDKYTSLKDFLNRFIYHHPIASKKLQKAQAVSIIGGVVPVGPPLNTVGKNVLLVGDSANQVIPSLGAGIPTSVIAGSIAGETIYKYLNGNCPLDCYEKTWKTEIGKALENGYKLRKIIDIICRSDRLMEEALRFFGKSHITDLIRTRYPTGSKFIDWVKKTARTL